MTVATAVRAAATGSVLVRDLVAGPVRAGAVVASGAAATYLDVGGRLLAVVAPGGVHLPCAVVLGGDGWSRLDGSSGGGPRPPGAPPAPGTNLAVGGGTIRGGRMAVGVVRWFDPRVRVAGVDPAAVDRLAALVSARSAPDPLLPRVATDRLAAALGAGDHRAAAAALLGRGTGLTPAGDDLLAGALAALRAVGSTAADGLGAAVRDMAPGRTSRLSAALLDAADRGAVVPEAAAVLRAVAAGRGTQGCAGSAALDDAVLRLTHVGHTSGWHLAAGLAVGLIHARSSAAACGGAR